MCLYIVYNKEKFVFPLIEDNVDDIIKSYLLPAQQTELNVYSKLYKELPEPKYDLAVLSSPYLYVFSKYEKGFKYLYKITKEYISYYKNRVEYNDVLSVLRMISSYKEMPYILFGSSEIYRIKGVIKYLYYLVENVIRDTNVDGIETMIDVIVYSKKIPNKVMLTMSGIMLLKMKDDSDRLQIMSRKRYVDMMKKMIDYDYDKAVRVNEYIKSLNLTKQTREYITKWFDIIYMTERMDKIEIE